jgi:hypothetical protein
MAKKCTCGKCADCKKSKGYIGSKADEKQDKKTMKGMTPAQKSKFKKEDAKMDKDKSLSKKEDTKKDNALAKKIKGKKK